MICNEIYAYVVDVRALYITLIVNVRLREISTRTYTLSSSRFEYSSTSVSSSSFSIEKKFLNVSGNEAGNWPPLCRESVSMMYVVYLLFVGRMFFCYLWKLRRIRSETFKIFIYKVKVTC